MRHIKSFTLPSIVLKPFYPISLLNRPFHKSLKSIVLSTKIHLLQSTTKHQTFKPALKNLSFSDHLKQSINKFPYCRIPKFTQKSKQYKQLSPEDHEKMIAFGSLFVVNEENRQKQLREIGEFLLKDQFENYRDLPLTGAKIFHWHYAKKASEIIDEINQGKIPEEQMTFYFQVLVNLLPQAEVREQVERLRQEKIKNMNSQIQSLYLKLLLRVQLPSIQIIDHLYRCFVEKSSQSSLSNVNADLQAAKILLTIDKFELNLSEKLKNEAMKIITDNIAIMDPVDHIQVIKHIYMSKSSLCKDYIEKVTLSILQMYKQQRGEQIHVPLMLKVLKYRSKLHLTNEMFGDIVNSFPEKFNTVFRQRNMNKEIFLSLISKQSTGTLNVEVKTQFGQYIDKLFKQYGNKDQLNEDELIRNIKLILKYGKDIRKQQLHQTLDILVNNIYLRARGVASDELKYYIFLVAHTFYLDKILPVQMNKQLLQIYDAQCSTSPNSQNLSRMINIEYQLSRKQLQASVRKNIFAYNYEQMVLAPVVYSYMFYLMKREKSKGSNEEKTRVLTALKKDIYRHFREQNFSMKVIYTLIDVLDELNYSDKFIYTDIQRAIGKHLSQAIQSSKGTNQNNKNENKGQIMLLPKDIIFMINKLSKKQRCSKKLSNFLHESNRNPSLMKDYAIEYLQSSRNWQNMRQNYKENRERERNRFESRSKQFTNRGSITKQSNKGFSQQYSSQNKDSTTKSNASNTTRYQRKREYNNKSKYNNKELEYKESKRNNGNNNIKKKQFDNYRKFTQQTKSKQQND